MPAHTQETQYVSCTLYCLYSGTAMPSGCPRRVLIGILASWMLLTASATRTHGTGCEKALDQSCPQWRSQGLRDCLQCVQDHWPNLKPTCTSQERADGKCHAAYPPSPPTPGPYPPLPPFGPEPTSSTPNIVFILTDDQDTMLGSMEAMPFTRALTAVGVNLTNFFAHTPVCCPSRSELLTGRYFHNIRNRANNSAAPHTSEIVSEDNCMHVNASMGAFEHSTFAVALQAKGYRTGSPFTDVDSCSHAHLAGMFGKYLNTGGMQHICPKPVGKGELKVPAGWTDFLGACPVLIPIKQ